ncbi:hypothetical protein B0T26DRAFT_635685 [Lasiosphaeria miniovina]|uniref:Mitochondrial distribution and morphology protein 12 n=1 Tax=Lasiosphaeria miniovina TaxID=1954250 RepID=A0AA40EEB2_9PEZI|nr:uncharacterized protein B0T26DRAFT_635685 [Lasiosphaeria miniovina]KAK0734316.1 hypothetical protein B0T26DRAFT_635685 [Lasiosphaeria miniovina]
MSIDLNWETVTGGPDGEELAHQIRDFIHTKFQSVPLPRFIKSVTVHDFEFGSIPPQVELKDITDPLPDFYEENDDNGGDDDDRSAASGGSGSPRGADAADDAASIPAELRAAAQRRRRAEQAAAEQAGSGGNGGGNPGGGRNVPPHLGLASAGSRNSAFLSDGGGGSPFLGVSTPGIPGGTSNLHYFHSHLASGLSGAQTPLAAVAGAHHLSNAWLDATYGHSSSTPNLHQQYPGFAGRVGAGRGGGTFNLHQLPPLQSSSHSRHPSQSSISIMDFNQGRPGPTSPTTPPGPAAGGLGILAGGGGGGGPALREKHSVSTLAPTSAGTSRPPTRDAAGALAALAGSAIAEDEDGGGSSGEVNDNDDDKEPLRRFRERRIEDMQAVFRIRYAGDIKLLLTADILLDYPMPSFVGIPLRLSITGLTFDGVGVLAQIRKRVHFCFLSPEDALAAVGGDDLHVRSGGGGGGQASTEPSWNTKMGGLLQEIRVESEIGQRQSGKQSLKNVDKVERFVLEQVRRIFEDEFVYPSFWTFLV